MEIIRKELLIAASQQIAFKVFTQQMDQWWPRTHHIGATPMTELVLEPGVNGRWYSKHEDGTEANIGYIMAWEPNARLVLAWQINGDFKYDPALITEVAVQFIPEGPNETRIMFEHRNLGRLGGGGKTAESMDQGWGQILQLYKTKTEQK